MPSVIMRIMRTHFLSSYPQGSTSPATSRHVVISRSTATTIHSTIPSTTAALTETSTRGMSAQRASSACSTTMSSSPLLTSFRYVRL
eukprot:CAMPEP_0179460584 /NCGR_PEP_ID=MMETSP0799-20121207/43582_1 /TAXON_ID=46947 /ORGANISM="Geminigera cryophila, Strain CCMP2564" /LENGTH=86 /DNA_ID=CAMNT_0021262877 /DNA_START=583 /DNA_END=843 /DNA_ORIENTATION=-